MSIHDDQDCGWFGTTGIAFHFKEGLMLGLESRASNERRDERRLKIKDDTEKFYSITTHTVGILLGHRNDCLELKSHLQDHCMHMKSVKAIFKVAVDYVNCYRGMNKRFGTIICGASEVKGKKPRIFSVYVNGDEVVETKDNQFLSLGSGSVHAINTAEKVMGSSVVAEYDFDMSFQDSLDFITLCLFDSTFRDLASGGPLRVYHVSATGWAHVMMYDVLDAYAMYYHRYNEENTLFMVFNSGKVGELVCTEDIRGYFRPYGQIEYCHRVAEIRVDKRNSFYFHRLVCKTPNDASKIYEHVEEAGPYVLPVTPGPAVMRILDAFPRRVNIDIKESKIRAYVNRASKSLLEILCSSRI